jgi:phosphoserine phosphatase RsbU/P
MATVLFGILDARIECLTFAVAGHPPPVLAAPGRPAGSLPAAVDPPIGVGLSIVRRQTAVELPRGATLYLYTDGLVERRGSDIRQGIDRLHAAARCGSPDAGCARIMSALVGNTLELGDDIALLGLRAAPCV